MLARAAFLLHNYEKWSVTLCSLFMPQLPPKAANGTHIGHYTKITMAKRRQFLRMKMGGRLTVYQYKNRGKTFLFFRKAHRFFSSETQTSSLLRT